MLIYLALLSALAYSQQQFLQVSNSDLSSYRKYKSIATISYLRSLRTTYQRELTEVYLNISDLQSDVGDTSSCESSITCSTCTLNSGCVWCSEENLCVDGDASGPTNITCDNYQYGQCDYSDCGSNVYCFTCLDSDDCGWCNSTQECYEAESDDPGNCESEDFYHGNSENDECPYDEDAEKEKEKYEKEQQIAILQEQAENLEEIIQELNEEIEELSNFYS